MESLLVGGRVALLVPGSPAHVDLVLALLADGVFPVPLHPALADAERDRILEPILRCCFTMGCRWMRTSPAQPTRGSVVLPDITW
ncbi:hypothetical protein ACFQW6_05185 [Nocardioides sp. GCM10028917]|uniref:hypothetical protein n=1 Tax=Nocardioides sp. GCM10028917 TaxID=3273408 RepID=UPI003608729F